MSSPHQDPALQNGLWPPNTSVPQPVKRFSSRISRPLSDALDVSRTDG